MPVSTVGFLRPWLLWTVGFVSFPIAGIIGGLAAGRSMAVLGEHLNAPGQVWHLPNDPDTRTTRQLADIIFRLAGQLRARVRQISPLVVRIASLANRTMRELLEMQYQFEEPFIVDSHKIIDELGGAVHPDRAGAGRDGRLLPVQHLAGPSAWMVRQRRPVTDQPAMAVGIPERSLPMGAPGHLVVAHRVVAVSAGSHGAGHEGVRMIDEHLDPDRGAGQRARGLPAVVRGLTEEELSPVDLQTDDSTEVPEAGRTEGPLVPVRGVSGRWHCEHATDHCGHGPDAIGCGRMAK
jgi:hypothetical protein